MLVRRVDRYEQLRLEPQTQLYPGEPPSPPILPRFLLRLRRFFFEVCLGLEFLRACKLFLIVIVTGLNVFSCDFFTASV